MYTEAFRTAVLREYADWSIPLSKIEARYLIERSSLYMWLTQAGLPRRSAHPEYLQNRLLQKFSDDDLIDLHRQGLSDREIGRRLSVGCTVICRRRAKLGMPANMPVGWPPYAAAMGGNAPRASYERVSWKKPRGPSPSRRKFSDETLSELHGLALNDHDIGRRLDVNASCVRERRIKLGLPANASPGWTPISRLFALAARKAKARARKAAALAVLLLTTQAHAHGEYTDLKNPNTGQLCCNNRDCAVRDPCMTKSMREGLFIAGRCYEIREEMVLPIPSWDGQEHGCFWGGQLRCVVRSAGT